MGWQRVHELVGSRGCRSLLAVGVLAIFLMVLGLGGVLLASHLLTALSAPQAAVPTSKSLPSTATATSVLGYQPQPQDTLSSLSMVSASDGWAVGTGYVSGQVYDPLLLHYTGRFWEQNTDVTNAALQAKRAGLQRVFMVSASEGWAVGNLDWASPTTENTSAAFILHFQGGHWHLQGTFDGTLQSLWMTSATDGWAVGSQGTEIGTTFLLHYDGQTWTPVSAPGAGLSEVMLTSPTTGWAIGFAAGTYIGQFSSLLLHYNGGSWNAVTCPAVDSFTALALDAATDGWLVGSRNQSTQTIFAHYTGQGWAEVETPISGNPHATITSLAVTSASEGWAIGVLQGDASAGGTPSTLYLYEQQGQWTQVVGPNAGWINSVWLTSASKGWAVGKGGTILHEQQGVWSVV